MCGCGVLTWCPGRCQCGCTHDTPEGQREQARGFARMATDAEAFLTAARAENAHMAARIQLASRMLAALVDHVGGEVAIPVSAIVAADELRLHRVDDSLGVVKFATVRPDPAEVGAS